MSRLVRSIDRHWRGLGSCLLWSFYGLKLCQQLLSFFFFLPYERERNRHVFDCGYNCYKPLFLNYKKPYMIPFQKTQKILRENIRFTRNSESKREFFTKHFEVNNFLIKAFSGLDLGVLRLLITSLFDCEKNDWGEWSKSSQGAFVLEVKVLALLASFSLIKSIFLLFLSFYICLTCLFSIGLLCLVVLSMVGC